MRKVKCYRDRYYGLIFLFVIISLLSLFNFETGTIHGLQSPSVSRTLTFLSLALFVFILSRVFCVKPIIYKCELCGEVFEELTIRDGVCPKCSGELMNVEEYYQKKRDITP